MNRYILDTDTLIDFSKGREPVVSLLNQWISNGDAVGVCAINITEFYAGLPQSERKNWDEFFESLAFWEITKEAVRLAGINLYTWQKEGKHITTTDSLIAAVAQEKDAYIVTSNSKDYPMSKPRVIEPREQY